MSTPLLPWFYDHVEPAALRIAERAADLEPADAQRAYLVEASRQIVASNSYCRQPPRGASGEQLSATLTWFTIIDEELEGYVGGERRPGDLIARGGGRLWAAFQAHEPICASWARGVAAELAPRVAGRRVLELGAGTGGTTRLLAPAPRPRPGFLQPREWLTAMHRAGYAMCAAQTWGDDRREFGGVFTAYA
jgi:hypothetical protein